MATNSRTVQSSPELICNKGSTNIVADTLSRLDKLNCWNNEVEPTLDYLIENFVLNKKDIVHSVTYNSIMRYNKSLIETDENKKILIFYFYKKTYLQPSHP